MALMTTEYEFLDLSDVKGAELCSLQYALSERNTSSPTFDSCWTDSSLEVSSCCSETASGASGAPAPAEEMAGAERGGSGGAYPHPTQQHHPAAWHMQPPNVYVSQVTANVNVHGYMGQYYQPQQGFNAGNVAERNNGRQRRERRNKRVPSPPPQHAPAPSHPPYYVHYPHPQYYAQQAQGAPLYHLPVYQPLVYGPYPYQTYYPDYPLPVEGDGEKGPEEYPPEVVMEQEAVEAYYASGHYGAPPYVPQVEPGVEYMQPMYLPHAHPPPIPMQQTHHQPAPHQFNVYAKNFVYSNKNIQEKVLELKTSPAVSATATPNVSAIETPLKELKIKGPSSPKIVEKPVEQVVAPPIISEKISPTSKAESKLPWVPDIKTVDVSANQSITPKSFPPVASANSQVNINKALPPVNKATKGPNAPPFSGVKQPTKNVQVSVPIQQATSTPKPPFGNRKPVPTNKSPSNENTDIVVAPVEHVKREPPLPPSKAPMPISITLQSQGLIVSAKSPFGHSRKPLPVEPPPAPQPPPPAPTASDFPPPPTPRNRGEPLPIPVVQPQPHPAPGKSWASLFSSKIPITTVTAITNEEPSSPTAAVAPNVQKPVAKVPPYDASPLATVENKTPPPRPLAAVTASYSEKTSANAVSNVVKPASPCETTPEVREVPPQKESVPAVLVQPSPFADDPNSYRMGEFLSKYQLDNRQVAIMPRGLTNRSNYCYVNAILQALIACPPFYNMLKALPYQTRRGKSSTPVIDSMVELCYEFSGTPTLQRGGRASANNATTGPLVPAGPPLDGGATLKVVRALRPFPGSQEGRQEDAEEFLGCLLNSLNDEMLELIKLVEPDDAKDINVQQNGITTQEQPEDEDDDDDEWKVIGPRNKGAIERRWAARRTPVADIFRGRTRLRLHKAAHNDVTDAVQPFFTLQLDIERATNVKDALELLAGKDTLEGVSDAWQQLSIEELPVVLLLHLKCFQLDTEGHTAKIVKNIDFPIDLKIDPKIMSSKLKYNTKQRLYKLFAVVYHEGVEAVKGHYLTDTFNGQVGWIRYDDSTVTQVNDSQVLKPKPPRMPYLLMYRRHDTLPPHRSVGKTE